MPIPGRRVVIDNSTLNAMVKNPAYAEFKCLDIVRNAKPAPGCKRCGGKDASAYNDAKLCIVGMPQAAKDRLKQLLNAATLRLVVPHGGTVQPYDI